VVSLLKLSYTKLWAAIVIFRCDCSCILCICTKPLLQSQKSVGEKTWPGARINHVESLIKSDSFFNITTVQRFSYIQTIIYEPTDGQTDRQTDRYIQLVSQPTVGILHNNTIYYRVGHSRDLNANLTVTMIITTTK